MIQTHALRHSLMGGGGKRKSKTNKKCKFPYSASYAINYYKTKDPLNNNKENKHGIQLSMIYGIFMSYSTSFQPVNFVRVQIWILDTTQISLKA